jgi:hypothetical protein
VILPFSPEEPLEQVAALGFADATGDCAAVIELGHLQQIEQAAGGAALDVRTTKDHPSEPGVNDRSGAHRAGFLGDVKIAVDQAPIVDRAFGLGDSQHLGVGGGISEGFDLVPGARDDLSFPNDDRSDRYLILAKSLAS